MKYDRPVWQLMYDCADDLPAPFRYEDVHGWFREHYPEVGPATIRAHLIGMSEGGRPKPVQFAARVPIFRRVARGMYEAIPPSEREVDPELASLDRPDRTPSGSAQPDPAQSDPAQSDPAVSDPTVSDPPLSEPAHTERAESHAAPGGPPPEGDRPRGARPDRDPSDVFAESAFLDAEVVEARPLTPTDDFDELIARAGLAAGEPTPADRAAEQADVLLLGSDGRQVAVPAPAREAYRDEEFQTARVRAQQRGARWFVLSTAHGLVHPQEWVSPDARDFAELDAAQRTSWAAWVVARLDALAGPVADRTVHVDAPAVQSTALVSALLDAGAVVTTSAHGTSAIQDTNAIRDTSTIQDTGSDQEGGSHEEGDTPSTVRPETDSSPVSHEESAASSPDPVVEPATTADVSREKHADLGPRAASEGGGAGPSSAVDEVLAALTDPDRAVAPAALDELHEVGGLFAWHVDGTGARTLNRGLVLPLRRGVVHVGHTASGLGTPRTIRGMVQDVHLHGPSRGSTFRLTVATVLREPLALRSLDDPRLTQWMIEHLRVTTWPLEDDELIRDRAERVVELLGPVLNLEHAGAARVRRRLQQLRTASA